MTVAHLIRSGLPWDATPYTECSMVITEGMLAIEWDTLPTTRNRNVVNFADIATTDTMCVDCRYQVDYAHHGNKTSWEKSPSVILSRIGSVMPSVNDDLRALAILAERHRDEFDVIRHVVTRRGKI